MRLREFAKIKEAPIGTTGSFGAALSTGIGKFTGLTIDYIKKYFKWRLERNVEKKKQKEEELKKSAEKMNPKEKKDAKTAVSDPKIISKFSKTAPAKSSSTASPYTGPTIRLVKGQRAQGGDGQEYVFGGGGQWINTSTGDDAKRDVAHTLFKQFLP